MVEVSVDTYLKGKNTSRYNVVRDGDVKILVAGRAGAMGAAGGAGRAAVLDVAAVRGLGGAAARA